jgi:hypothetical protein
MYFDVDELYISFMNFLNETNGFRFVGDVYTKFNMYSPLKFTNKYGTLSKWLWNLLYSIMKNTLCKFSPLTASPCHRTNYQKCQRCFGSNAA